MPKKFEILYPGDKVVYNKQYYSVITAHYIAVDGIQKVKVIRMADLKSNRTKLLPSKIVRADKCKIIYESEDEEVKEERRREKEIKERRRKRKK